jgi:hypothetical protein
MRASASVLGLEPVALFFGEFIMSPRSWKLRNDPPHRPAASRQQSQS